MPPPPPLTQTPPFVRHPGAAMVGTNASTWPTTLPLLAINFNASMVKPQGPKRAALEIDIEVDVWAGGWKRLRTWKKRPPPPHPPKGCLRKKSRRAIIVALGKKFSQGPFLVQKWNSLHQISNCTWHALNSLNPLIISNLCFW